MAFLEVVVPSSWAPPAVFQQRQARQEEDRVPFSFCSVLSLNQTAAVGGGTRAELLPHLAQQGPNFSYFQQKQKASIISQRRGTLNGDFADHTLSFLIAGGVRHQTPPWGPRACLKNRGLGLHLLVLFAFYREEKVSRGV